MPAREPESNPLEALAAEFVDRHRRGEAPSVEQYASLHPGLATEIRNLFPTIMALEKVRAEQEQVNGARVPAAAKLKRLGDLRIVREIGRGGMGIVYEAIQESLGRRVAVKVLAHHSRLDDTHRRRFFREARTAARLHHTNIVPILGVGEQEGLDYFVMQYIDGVGLDSVITRMRRTSADPAGVRLSSYWRKDLRHPNSSSPTQTGPVAELAPEAAGSNGDSAADPADVDRSQQSPPAHAKPLRISQAEGEAARGFDTDELRGATQPLRRICRTYWQDVAFVGLQVAQALEYAHSQGTLHRDIKPGNLLLDEGGTTWVADFGLAKAMDQDAVSRTGEVLGTLLYMAPEQWRGKTDARSDLYSLGVTLYELATLRVPREANERVKTIGASRLISAVTAPRKIWPACPVDLETIILKAMADEPAHRYQTAAELASDLARFLQDRPISVRRPSLWERWWRWRRRNPIAAYSSTAAAALLILVGAVTAAAYLQTRVALKQASEANDEKGRALASEKFERERAESLLTTSLAALDSVFNRLVPDQLDQGRTLTVSGQDQGSQAAAVSPESAALLEELLKVYDQLAKGQTTQARLGIESARASRRIGDIHARLGNWERAGAAYRQSIEKYQALSGSASDQAIQLEIARLHNDLGAILDRQRESARSRGEYQLALAILQPQKTGQASAEVRFESARTHFLLGRAANPQSDPEPPPHGGPPHATAGRPPDGGADGHRDRPPGDPRDGPPDFEPGKGPPEGPPPHDGPPPHEGPPPHDESPDASRATREGHAPPKRADREELGLAIGILEPLAKSDPKNPSYRYLLAQCYREEADPHAASSVELTKAEGLLTELVKEHPDVADYHFALADTYAMSDIRELAPQDFERAEKNLRAALAESTALVDRNPYATDYAVLHVHILHKLAGILRNGPPERVGAPTVVDEVGRLYQEAIRRQAGLVERFPDNVGYLFWLAKFRMSLGEFWLERRHPGEAKKVFETAIHDLEPRYKGQISQGPLGDILRELYEAFAEALGHLGEEQAARAAEQKASTIGPARPGPRGHDHFRPRRHPPGPPPDGPPGDEGPDEFGPPHRRHDGPPGKDPPDRHRPPDEP
jgi:serine/threonine protein kinase